MSSVKKSVPVLRFPGFEDEWNVNKLASISDKISVGIATSTTEYFCDDGVPLLRNQNIKAGVLDDRNLLYITNDFARQNKNKALKTGDVLTVRTGYPGISCVVPEKYDGCQTFTTLITRPKKEILSPSFLTSYLNSDIGKNQLLGYAAGGAQKNINAGSLQGVKVPLPTLPEQEKIAAFLSDIDSKIEKTTRKKELLTAYKKGMMQKLFSRELRFKDDNGNEFPAWQEKKISDMIDDSLILGHLDGNHGELYPRSDEFVTTGVPYISANAFDTGTVDFTKVKYLPEERAKQFKKGIALDGDVLFAHNATVGPVAILRTDLPFVILSTTATYFRCNTDFLSIEYWSCFLQSDFFVKQYTRTMGQSTRNQVPITMQRKFNALIPSLVEQQKIATFLTDLDTKITAVDSELNQLKEFKRGLLQKMFV